MGDTPLASDLTGAALLSDSELVLRARQGDRRAFGTLYLRHHDAAWRVACAAAGSATDAEDAVAEGFAKVFAALPRMVDRELAFRPYLLACVRNAAVDRHRRTRKIDLRDDVPEGAAVGAAAAEPDEIVLADLERNLVGEALRSLPERWRTVLWLTEVEGMTPTEVSAVIGIKPNAVAALSYRAREGLREAYLQAHIRAEARADCRFTVDRLGPYVRNELSHRDRDKVQAHLDGCANCRQRRDELADVNASLLGALVPPPLLLGSRTQQEWLAVAHLGKGTRRARPPAKAAKAAQLGTSPAVQRTMALVVALLLMISGGVAVQRFGPDGRTGKTFDPVAIPKRPTPATPPGGEGPTEEALPAPGRVPAAQTPAPEPAADAPVELAAPVAPPAAPEPAVAASPAPAETAPAPPEPTPEPAPAPAPEPAPEPAPAPEEPPPAPEPPSTASARASVGEGDNGAVVAMSVPDEPAENPQPDVDVTVGSTPLVGDAPPSEGTDVDISVSPSTALERILETMDRQAALERPPASNASMLPSTAEERILDAMNRQAALERPPASNASLLPSTAVERILDAMNRQAALEDPAAPDASLLPSTAVERILEAMDRQAALEGWRHLVSDLVDASALPNAVAESILRAIDREAALEGGDGPSPDWRESDGWASDSSVPDQPVPDSPVPDEPVPDDPDFDDDGFPWSQFEVEGSLLANVGAGPPGCP